MARYLEIISPLLGPGREVLGAINHAEIQPLPVTTDANGQTLSLHPITGCHQTRVGFLLLSICLISVFLAADSKGILSSFLEIILFKELIRCNPTHVIRSNND